MKPDKTTIQTKQLIFHNIMEIVELFPQYTVVQHLYHILRRKGDAKDPYTWEDTKLLKKFEDYRDELEIELANNGVTEPEL